LTSSKIYAILYIITLNVGARIARPAKEPNMKTTEKTPRIKTIVSSDLRDSVRTGGCGNCRASCQSACKTSCTVANQSCENLSK